MTRCVVGWLLAISCAIASTGVVAQAWPAKPIRWIVPYTPGGPTDFAARSIANQVAAAVGQPVIVENRAGAGTTIGVAAAAKAPADGYTVLSVDNSLVFTAALYKSLSYDPQRDLAPLAMYGLIPFILVVQSELPIRTVQELIAYAKAEPGKLSFGSPGVGSPHHLYMELFKLRTGTDLLHVPYKGGAPLQQDLAAGRLSISTSNAGLVMPLIKSGKVRPLAVTTARRVSMFPEYAPIADSGVPEFDAFAWQGAFVPVGTPPEIAQALSREILRAMERPETRKQFTEMGIEPAPTPPAAFAQLLKADFDKWLPMIRSLGIRLE